MCFCFFCLLLSFIRTHPLASRSGISNKLLLKPLIALDSSPGWSAVQRSGNVQRLVRSDTPELKHMTPFSVLPRGQHFSLALFWYYFCYCWRVRLCPRLERACHQLVLTIVPWSNFSSELFKNVTYNVICLILQYLLFYSVIKLKCPKLDYLIMLIGFSKSYSSRFTSVLNYYEMVSYFLSNMATLTTSDATL